MQHNNYTFAKKRVSKKEVPIFMLQTEALCVLCTYFLNLLNILTKLSFI